MEKPSVIAKSSKLPSMPEIGQPESYYAQKIHEADHTGDIHTHAANKVAQYVTLAMDPALRWSEKLRYFQHALRRHCSPPALPDDEVWMFYRSLADLIRTYCGAEALRIASAEDDIYAKRLSSGIPRDAIETEAEAFFIHLLGGSERCPDYFHDDDFHQLKLLRDQWI